MLAEAVPSFIVAPALAAIGATITLPDEESHYLVRVCRVRAGDRVTATDGRGCLATLRIGSAHVPVEAEIETLERAERRRCLILLCGAPEGERADWMVEKLAELGLGTFQPVQCERGVWRRAGDRIGRWRRLARAALRQSQGRFEMEVKEPVDLAAALKAMPAGAAGWVADREGERAAGVGPPPTGLAVGAVGPAAGFTASERAKLIESGLRPLALAPTRLRTETAALAWVAWWAAGGE